MTSATSKSDGISRPRLRRRLLADRYGGNYLPVVVWLVAFYILLAVATLESDGWSVVISAILTVLVPLGMLSAGVERPRVFASGIASVVAGGMLIAGVLADSTWLAIAGGTLLTMLFLALQVAILLDVVHQSDVRIDTILGSVAAYLILSLLWAYAYLTLVRLDADALSGANGAVNADLSEMLYFSVVTQTTLGYGDIQPSIGAARAMVELQAVLGQLYIAILVAWIVGRLVSRRESMNPSVQQQSDRHMTSNSDQEERK